MEQLQNNNIIQKRIPDIINDQNSRDPPFLIEPPPTSITDIDAQFSVLKGKIKHYKNIMLQKNLIEQFIFTQMETAYSLLEINDFKNAFYIYYRLDLSVQFLLTDFLPFDTILFPIKNIINSYKSEIQNSKIKDISLITKIDCTLIIKQLPGSHKEIFLFGQFLMEISIKCINNMACIYLMLAYTDKALDLFNQSLNIRLTYKNSNQSLYQIACILLNLSFGYKQLQDYSRSKVLIKKSILFLEEIDKRLHKNPQIVTEILESSCQMINLIEYYFQKTEKIILDIYNGQKERLLYLMSINYKYLAQILEKINLNTSDADFCYQMSELLKQKLEQNLQVKFQSSLFKHDLIDKNSKKNENFQNENELQYVNKNNIIYKKQIIIEESKMKVVVVVNDEKNCIIIFYYNKMINFFRKLIVPQAQLKLFKKDIGKSQNEQTNDFFQLILQQTKFIEDQPKLKGIITYPNFESLKYATQNPFIQQEQEQINLQDDQQSEKLNKDDIIIIRQKQVQQVNMLKTCKLDVITEQIEYKNLSINSQK